MSKIDGNKLLKQIDKMIVIIKSEQFGEPDPIGFGRLLRMAQINTLEALQICIKASIEDD